jgi:hypothetical protein
MKEEQIRRIQKQAGWSDATLLGILLDFFWNTQMGEVASDDLEVYLRGQTSPEQ